MMTSYAHNHEDVLLARLFPGQSEGCYIDVGANHPVHGSVSYHFYTLGWRGVTVEPIASLHALYQTERPGDVSLNVGVSSQAGQLAFWEGTKNAAGLSSFSEVEVEAHRRAGFEFIPRSVPVITLAAVCEQHVRDRTIDFLSIDVEGHERHVLLGGDFRRFRPRAVVVEATRPNTQIPTHSDWEDLLLAADYHYAAFDGLNRYYVRGEDVATLSSRLATPVSSFDEYVPFETQVLRGKVRALEEELAEASLRGKQKVRALEEELAEASLRGKEKVRALEEQLAEALRPKIGEGALGVARRLDALYRRFPRLMSAAGRLLRRSNAGPH